MQTNKNIQNKIDDTFKAFEAIEEVNVSPFFKDKTLQRLFTKKEVESKIWSWFTPQLQFATLVCVVVLNIVAFSKLNEFSYDENLNEFAETYGLSSNDETSLLN